MYYLHFGKKPFFINFTTVYHNKEKRRVKKQNVEC